MRTEGEEKRERKTGSKGKTNEAREGTPPKMKNAARISPRGVRERSCYRTGAATTLSHLVWFTFTSGWETQRCQITAWKASLWGVMLLALTVGMITQASA